MRSSFQQVLVFNIHIIDERMSATPSPPPDRSTCVLYARWLYCATDMHMTFDLSDIPWIPPGPTVIIIIRVIFRFIWGSIMLYSFGNNLPSVHGSNDYHLSKRYRIKTLGVSFSLCYRYNNNSQRRLSRSKMRSPCFHCLRRWQAVM